MLAGGAVACCVGGGGGGGGVHLHITPQGRHRYGLTKYGEKLLSSSLSTCWGRQDYNLILTKLYQKIYKTLILFGGIKSEY